MNQDSNSQTVSAQGSTAVPSLATPSTATQAPSSAQSEKSLDELLTQLETLNKQIETKTTQQPKIAAADEPALPKPANTEKLPTEQAQPQLSSQDEQTAKKDFDLDGFIKDLEAKLDQEDQAKTDNSQQATSAPAEAKPAADETAFFRQVRAKADLTSQATESSNQEKPIAKPTLELSQQPVTKLTAEPSLKADTQSKPQDAQVKQELDQLITNLEESVAKFEQKQSDQTKSAAKPVAPVQPQTTQPKANEAAAAQPAPAQAQAETTPTEPAQTTVDPESLAAQNVFEMLGLTDIKVEDREAFLNDLERLIWDDFVEVDLPLLLTKEELTKAKEILAQADLPEDEIKEQLLVYLQDLVPGLEQAMYQKALKLKEELMLERLRKLKDQATEQKATAKLADLTQAEQLIAQQRYQSAIQLLNKA